MISKESFEQLLPALAPYIREIAEQYPAYLCYRSTKDDGHYVIGTYYRTRVGGSISVVLVHGKDSFFAGVKTFDQAPTQLVPCACGKWEWPTQEQVAAAKLALAAQSNRDPKTVALRRYDLEASPNDPMPSDPDEILKLYVDALKNNWVEEQQMLFTELDRWLRCGGREPAWSEYPDYPDLRRRFFRGAPLTRKTPGMLN